MISLSVFGMFYCDKLLRITALILRASIDLLCTSCIALLFVMNICCKPRCLDVGFLGVMGNQLFWSV